VSTSGPDGSSAAPYRLIYTQAARRAVRETGEKAKQLGLLTEFLAAAKSLEVALRSDPLGLGEPLYELKFADLEVRAGGHEFLTARFAVDRKRRLVYVVYFSAIGHGF
jgi:hypothetical protein